MTIHHNRENVNEGLCQYCGEAVWSNYRDSHSFCEDAHARGRADERAAQESSWHDDKPDEWTPAIEAAFPTRSGSHDEYATAMKMVGHRRSKGALVALVNWLLVEQGAHVAKGEPGHE